MKVLFVTDIYEKYGAFDSFIQMVYYLNREAGVSPIILTSKKKKVYNWALNNHFECVYMKYSPFVFETRFKERSFLWYLKKIAKLFFYRLELKRSLNKCEKKIDFSSIDIIHSNTNRIDIGACLSQRYKIPHVWHIREFGSTIDYNTFTLRNDYIQFMNETSYFIFISKAIRDYWVSRGLKEEKSITLWNGIIEKKYEPNQIFQNNNVRIIMSGFIRKSKGQDQILNALSKMPINEKNKFYIDFYGDIDREYYLKLRRMIKDGNLERQVSFKGFVENVKELYSKYDIGVTCSKSEGLGRTTIDYMSLGCLVIASNTGANIELIGNNKNGYLYKYGDSNELKNVLLYSINNIDESKKIALNGYNFSNNNFLTSNYALKVFDFYNHIKNNL